MPEPVVEIPNRPAFRASEVCELAQIPPYVLKSWEKEFPNLGVATKPGAPRIYRRADVEQVLRIKQLLFKEGLTLAGARKRLEGEPKVEEEPLPELPLAVGGEVRDKVARVKQELRSLLELLSKSAPSTQSTPPIQSAPLTQSAASTEPATESRPWPPAKEPGEQLEAPRPDAGESLFGAAADEAPAAKPARGGRKGPRTPRKP